MTRHVAAHTVTTGPAAPLAAVPPLVAMAPALLATRPPLLTCADVAATLRVDVYTVRRWIREEQLPAYRLGRELRVDPDTLRGWLDRRQT